MSSDHRARILLVDDDPMICLYYGKALENAGYTVDAVTRLLDMRQRLIGSTFDVVLLDLNLDGESGLDGLNIILKESPYSKVFFLTANGSVAGAVEAMQRGATGFFEKSMNVTEMFHAIDAAVAAIHAPSAHVDFRSIGLIGNSPAIVEISEKIQRIQNVDSMVLILGESGTGKEIIARAIHQTSTRKAQRFAAINCGAIPENLLESELFGHRKGAFTDAKSDRKGIFELCTDGTLLLDEIGDMPLPLQMKILRVLQEREINPIGATSVVKVNTRVIAATHRNILEESRANRFRADLYFRLSVVVLHVPALRQRREDIPELVSYFLAACNGRFGRAVRMPSASAMRRICSYEWPGNVRELQNAIERAVVLSNNDEIDMNDVFAHLSIDRAGICNVLGATDNLNDSQVLDSAMAELFDQNLSAAKDEFEKRYLDYQVHRFKGCVSDIAEKAGRYRADVYRLLRRYNIDHGSHRTP